MPEIDRAEYGLLRGIAVALLLALPFWAVVFWAVHRAWRGFRAL